jgi:hypothetical protein
MKTIKRMSTICILVFLMSNITSTAQKIDINSITKAVNTVTKQATPLSKDDIANGLKNALTVGSSNASTKLNKPDGFLKDAAVKILLPPEAQSMAKNISLIPGGKKLVDDVVIKMNRAAEDAAITAKPIFINAITSMTIADAWNILHGSDDAATSYLKRTSSAPLQMAFQPKINESLSKKLIGGISAAEAWRTLMNANNKAAKSVAGRMAGMKSVNANLAQYVTERALNGMFIKIADEEKSIRKNPVARVNDILKKVFGDLDKK